MMRSILLSLVLILIPFKVYADNPTPTPPPVIEAPVPNEQEPIPEELNEEPRGEENPLLPPNLDELIDKKISEDVWQQLKGDLPCVTASTECVTQLQAAALQSNPVLRELDTRIEEANNRIEEARDNNIKSINITTLSPFLQAAFGTTLTPLKTSKTDAGTANPLNFIFGNFFANILGNALQGIFNWQGLQSTGDVATRSIAISDLQIKVAELQRSRAQAADILREKVLIELLKLEEIARSFQIEQEIAKRDKARLEIIKVSYQFGEGNSESYLQQLSNYDRQKAATWREWSKLRSQLVKVKILVFGTEQL